MATRAGGGAEAPVRKRRAVSIATINGDGSDRYAVGRREAVRGGCGKNFLFFTPRGIPIRSLSTRRLHDGRSTRYFESAPMTPIRLKSAPRADNIAGFRLLL
jgi:hypothetical protein